MTGDDRQSSKGAACRCGRCGASYERAAFMDLAPVRTLESTDLAGHVVVSWPAGVTVDVRACARCSTPIARLRRAS